MTVEIPAKKDNARGSAMENIEDVMGSWYVLKVYRETIYGIFRLYNFLCGLSPFHVSITILQVTITKITNYINIIF